MKDEDWIKLANKHLKGKTIREVKRLNGKHLKDIGWEDHRALQIIFTDGSWITPSIDEEGNSPGCLFTTFKGLASTLI
jgi:hypothetical protein